MGEEKPLVEMRRVTKRFPGVVANREVDFTLLPGEIHALLGENGAGKTTLMNILYGLYKPDSGEVVVKGRRVRIRSPQDSIKLGIGMVHQHFKLVESHTVVENIILGLREAGFVLNIKRSAERIRELASKYDWDINPYARVWQLTAGEKQMVEILKALYRGADILILDEPTAVLTPQEVRGLFNSLLQMKKEGKGIIFITHKLDEVMEISDRVTVMRRGRVVAVKRTREATKEELAKLMVGRPVLFRLEKEALNPGRVVLRLQDVHALSDKGVPALRGVSLDVREREILGVAGVTGNGQVELAEVITGLRRVVRGRVLLDGEDVTNSSPKALIERGVAYIPPERQKQGLVLGMSVTENLVLRHYRYPPFSNGLTLDWARILDNANKLIERFEIVVSSPWEAARNLSGGNQQKVVVARELSGKPGGGVPKLIVAMYPTRGLDVGATEYVRKILLRYRGMGSAILLISEDLEEIFQLSDRIAVVFEGQITGVVRPEETSVEEVGLLMAGSKRIETLAK